jgi:glutathione peroxidase
MSIHRFESGGPVHPQRSAVTRPFPSLRATAAGQDWSHGWGRIGFVLALLLTAFALLSSARPASAQRLDTAPAADPSCPPILRHTYNALQTGKEQSLCAFKGKVVLVVNTASFCGYTYQYEGLEALYRKYRDRGLVVLGFPSNDYGRQEPGTNKEIAEFCRTTYGVQFPMFEKATGTKLAATPLYVQLVAKTGEAPRWNFHKYVVDRRGERVQSFGSDVEPDQREFVSTLERLLAEKPAS